MAARTPSPAVSGLGLIVLCFVGSAALRLTENGVAFAEELSAAAGDATAADDGCSGNADALMESIRQREGELDSERKRLADRAQTLSVAEAKLKEQLAAFELARKNLEATLAVADQAAEKDIARMTTVYESMKPADAAKIFEKMDVGFAAGLLARMRPEAAAAVMTGMKPESAYAVMVTIASRNAAVPKE